MASCYQVRCRYPAAARADGAQSSAWPGAHFPSTKLSVYPLCCLVSFPLQKQIIRINIEKRSWGTGEMGQQVRALLGDPCRGSAAAVTLYTCFIHCTGVKISISRRLLSLANLRRKDLAGSLIDACEHDGRRKSSLEGREPRSPQSLEAASSRPAAAPSTSPCTISLLQ